MKIEIGINPNCSEAVFRFYTLDPKEIQTILQAIADEISVNTGFTPHQKQKVPLFKTAEEYDTNYKEGELSYSGEIHKKYDAQINKIWKDRDDKVITQEEALEKSGKIEAKMCKEIYPNSLLKACAGLGDNDAVVTIEKDKEAFRLNIGNNDISDNKTDWTDKVKALGIKVEEAEYSKDLQKHSRDCTCGCTWFDGYKNLIKDKE